MTQLAGKSPVADYENQLRSSGLVGLGGGKGVLGQRYVFRKRGSLIGQLKKTQKKFLLHCQVLLARNIIGGPKNEFRSHLKIFGELFVPAMTQIRGFLSHNSPGRNWVGKKMQSRRNIENNFRLRTVGNRVVDEREEKEVL